MGNSSTRYLSNFEAADVLGGQERWNGLKSKLERVAGKYVDYRLFCNIIQRRYEKIPRVLCEALFRAFAADLSRRIDIDVFLSTYAVLDSLGFVDTNKVNAQLLLMQKRCLFRIYELSDSELSTAAGVLQRRRVEEMLRVAYGDKLRPHLGEVQKQLDNVFHPTQSTEITLKEFEGCTCKLEMLAGWVRSVVRCFELTDISNTRLFLLERKYSANLDYSDLQAQYGVSVSVCNELRKRFFELCASGVNKDIVSEGSGGDGSGEETVNLSVRAELQYNAWMSMLTTQCINTTTSTADTTTNTTANTTSTTNNHSTIAYLHPTLASVIFNAKVDIFQPKWRFNDFASFCAVFGGSDVDLQVSTVVDAFIHTALVKYYGSNGGSSESERVIYEVNSSSGESDVSSPFGLLSPVGSTSSDAIVYDSSNGVDGRVNMSDLQSPVGNSSVGSGSAVQSVDEYILHALNDMILTLATPATHPTTANNIGTNTTNSTSTSNRYSPLLHKDIQTSLHTLNTTTQPEYYTAAFSELILTHIAHLPGMRDLSLVACCKFGFNPSSPLREMELCTELSLRYLYLYPQSALNPFGPEGTEWCVIPKIWYDSWKLYVGHQHHHNISSGANSSGYITNSTYGGSAKLTAYNTNFTKTTNTINTTNTTYNNTTAAPKQAHTIPASVAGSVLDLDGLTPPSPPQTLRNTAYYGNGGSKRGNGGNNGTSSANNGSVVSNTSGRNSMKRLPSPLRPGPIDTTSLLRKHTYYRGSVNTTIGSKQGQLLPNLVCGREVEIVAPDVYNALVGWYGGGPKISRCVVRGSGGVASGSTIVRGNCSETSVGVGVGVGGGVVVSGGSPSAIPSRPNAAYKAKHVAINTNTTHDTTSASNSSDTVHSILKVTSPRLTPYTSTNTTISNTTNTNTTTYTTPSELELYPLCVNIHICNNSGVLLPTPLVEQLMFSKHATIHDICVFLSNTHEIDLTKVRLWNYALPKPEQWREQYVLSPELTLCSANIVDNQILLLECSQGDGSWPRSVLHSQLDNESGGSNSGSAGSVGSASGLGGASVKGVGDVDRFDNSINECSVYVDEYLGVTYTNNTTDTTNSNPNQNTNNIYDTSLSGSGTITDTIASTLDAAANTLFTIAGEVNSVLGAPLPSHNKHNALSDRSIVNVCSTSTVNTPKHNTTKDTTNTNTNTSTTSTTLTTTQCIQRIQHNSGHVGLDNLGNTCYLNSSLQALLHTQPLVEYFLSYAYTKHINTTSMHGFKGKLAQAFAALVYETYTTSSTSITPRTFKNSISAMHTQFVGNEQHDAQELLAFLLDGLSEDLNLVHTKPYTIQPDSDHRTDSVLADIWWANHLKRDKSVIQAMFSGQFKSTMKCSKCSYTSARFEPFNFISVPVPEEIERVIYVTVVCSVASHSVVCSVRVPKAGTLHDVVRGVLELGLYGLRGVYCGSSTSTDTITTGTTDTCANSAINKRRKLPRKPQKHTTNTTTTTTNTTNTNSSDPTHYYIQAAELTNNRIRSFNSLERRIETIRDGDSIVLFQVRRVYGNISGNPSVNVGRNGSSSVGDSSDSSGSSVDIDTTTLHNTIVNAAAHSAQSSRIVPAIVTKKNGSDSAFDPECLFHNYNNSDQWVRVAFTQRRARMHDSAIYNNNSSNNNTTEFSILGNGLMGTTTTITNNGAGTSNSSGSTGGASTSKGSGTEYFKLEAFGVSALEVLPNRIRCGDLYKLVAQKFAAYLKVPIAQLIRHRRQQRDSQRQAMKHTASAQSLSSLTSGGGGGVSGKGGLQRNTTNNTSSSSLNSNDATEEYPVNLRTTQVGPAESDEVLGGAIPAHGFTLRLVNGGTGVHSVCSRCPWLRHCDGCVLPEHSKVDVELRDGESVAIDWHFEVYETVLDTLAASTVRKHAGSMDPSSATTSIHTPLARCFDKFTEQEPLDDIVCPTCKESTLNKAFTLWRLPPVLIVQLKRFKYDRTSRRKLNNHVDFPMYDLDLYDYLASSRQQTLSRSRAATLDATDLTTNTNTYTNTNTSATVGSTGTGAESATIPNPISSINTTTTSGDTDLAMAALFGDTPSTNVTSPNDYSTNTTTNPTTLTANPTTSSTPHVEYDDLCTHYDLYSVVHHAGALGGGHYATTCRALNMNIGCERGSGGGGSSAHNASSASVTNNVNTNIYTTNTGNTVNEDQWYCYNDNIVTTIHTSEICAPSAYLLFYMRKDMRQGDVLALLRRQLSLPVVVVDESSSSGSVEAHISSGSEGGNGGDDGNVGVSGSEGGDGGNGSGDDVGVGSEVSSSAGYSSNNSVADEPVVDNNDNIVEKAATTTTTAGPIAETTVAEPIQTTNTANTNTTTHTTNTNTTNTDTNTTHLHPRSGNNIANMGFSGFIDDSEHSSTSNSSTNNNTSGGAGNRGSKKEEGGCIPS